MIARGCAVALISHVLTAGPSLALQYPAYLAVEAHFVPGKVETQMHLAHLSSAKL
jgi:hypothetical protein